MALVSRLFRELTTNMARRPRIAPRRPRFRPTLEVLEDRLQPSASSITVLAPPDPPPPPVKQAPPPPAPQAPSPASVGGTDTAKPDKVKPDKAPPPPSGSGTVFSENDVLVASKMDTTNGTFDVWYSDEHALALGVREVIVKTSSGTTVTDYPVTPLTSNPGAATNPAVGATATTGDQAGTDVYGYMLAPSLYITDLTTGVSSTVAIAPSAVFGTWKYFVRTVDYTRSATTPTVTLKADADPAKNGWNLGAGADAPPSGLHTQGYTAEVSWNLNALYQQGVLQAGDNYSFKVIVHDGDQNKAGGDAGEATYNVGTYSGPPSPPSTAPAGLSGFVYNVNGGGQTGIAGVTLTLTGTTANGQTVTMTTTTAADGSYLFAGLQAGTYTVTQTVPTGMFGSTTSPGTVDGAIDGSVMAQETISEILLLSGKNGVNYDFGDIVIMA